MPEKILQYAVLDFDSHDAAMEVAGKIKNFVSIPEGRPFAHDPNRAVVWVSGSQLFVSDGAIRAAGTCPVMMT